MNLGRILNEHRPVVVFTLLVCLSLVSLATGTQSHFIARGVQRVVAATAYPFLKARSLAERSADYTFDFIFRYNDLREENSVLKRDIIELQEELTWRSEALEENERLRGMVDFVRENPRLTLEPARVIESYKGVLRIDRGRVHGISPAMCAMTREGVVGVVTEVDDFSSLIATLHHPECKIGAMVQRNRIRAYDGVVHASGSDLSRICTMWYIDMGVAANEIRPGDVVVTSPESVFGSGFPIGKIVHVQETSSLWKQADIDPFVDPYRIDEVFIVRRALAPPGDATEFDPRHDLSKAPELPDERSMQERYAP